MTDLGSASGDAANAVAIDADGKIVVGGSIFGGGSGDFALVRYLGDPSDTAPPTITIPFAVTANATSPTGAIVTYVVTVTDDVDPNPIVACAPPSGSTFPIGATTVNCTATDAAGNQATASFTVRVKGATEQLADLLTAVTGVGSGTSLADKVRQAQASLSAHDVADACATIDTFIAQVPAQSGKSIPAGTATHLIADATRIKSVLACWTDRALAEPDKSRRGFADDNGVTVESHPRRFAFSSWVLTRRRWRARVGSSSPAGLRVRGTWHLWGNFGLIAVPLLGIFLLLKVWKILS